MVVIFGIVTLFAIVAFMAPIHGIGVLCALFIVHWILYYLLGDVAVHLPLYCGIVIVLALLVRRRWRLLSVADFGLIVSVVISMSISSLLGIDQERSLVSMLLYIKGFGLAFVVGASVSDEKDIRTITRYILVALSLGAIFQIEQFISGQYVGKQAEIGLDRAIGLRGDPNDTAMLLITGIPLAIYWLTRSRDWGKKAFYSAELLLITVGMLLTKSRGGFVALCIVLALLYVRFISLKTTIVAFFVVIVIGITGYYVGYWDRVATLFTLEERGHSLESRMSLLKGGGEIFFNNALLGVGPGNFGLALKELRENRILVFKKIEAESVAHNFYVEFAAENGVIGLVLLMLTLLSSLLGLIRLNRRLYGSSDTVAIYIFVACIGLLASGLFLSQGKNSVLWFFLGLGFAANRLKGAGGRNTGKTGAPYRNRLQGTIT